MEIAIHRFNKDRFRPILYGFINGMNPGMMSFTPSGKEGEQDLVIVDIQDNVIEILSKEQIQELKDLINPNYG